MVHIQIPAWCVPIPDLCDQYLAPEIPARYVLLECICFWKFTNEVLRRDINYTIATEAVCRPYEHRIKYHARKPFAALPCLNPPCPEFSETSVESSEAEEEDSSIRRRPSSSTLSPLLPSSPNPPLAEGHVVASVQNAVRRAVSTPQKREQEELPQGDDPSVARRAADDFVSISHDEPSQTADVIVHDYVKEQSQTAEEHHASTHWREKMPERKKNLHDMLNRKHPKSTARSTSQPLVIDEGK